MALISIVVSPISVSLLAIPDLFANLLIVGYLLFNEQVRQAFA